MFVVCWAVPWHAMVYEAIKCFWISHHGCIQCVARLIRPTKLPEGRGQPAMRHCVIGIPRDRISRDRSPCSFRRLGIVAFVIVGDRNQEQPVGVSS